MFVNSVKSEDYFSHSFHNVSKFLVDGLNKIKIMSYLVFILRIILCMHCLLGLNDGNGIEEFCPLETFSPKCEENEIVIIQHAIYGRMKVGKCIQADFFIGCSVRVLDIADKLCSGTRACDLFIPNSAMIDKLDCLPDSSLSSSSYLEVSYSCQKVNTPRSSGCMAPEKLKITQTTQNIASETSKQTSCGLHGSPWILEAQPGQVIDISILDFFWKNQTIDNNLCDINYGYIMDMENDNVINICGGGERVKSVYTSSGHSVQIVLESNAVSKHRFMLSFTAHGCPEYKPPNHSWIQKENDSLVIGCVSSDKTWKLRCVDNRWLGMVGNCTSPPTPVVPAEITSLGQNVVDRHGKSSVQVPHISNNHVIVFTMACLTVLLCCVIVILGVYCIKRYDVKIKKYSKTNYNTIPTASFHNGQMTFSGMSTVYKPVSKQQNTIRPPAYTLTHTTNNSTGPAVPPRNNTANKDSNIDRNGLTGNSTYENVTDDAESVQYYILENPAESV